MELSSSDNYFELFQLPVQYPLDTAQLSERYRELQRIVHPDRFVGASAQESRLAQQKSTLINDAYHVLRDDLRRAQHLLQLKGVDYQQHKLSDSMFLMEQMELREELELISASKDLDRLSSLFARAQGLQRQCKTQLAAHLLEFSNMQAASDEVIKLQFLNKLCEEAEQLEESLY